MKRALLALLAAALLAAGCGHLQAATSSHPAAKASAKAEASALAGLPAAAQIRADLQACITSHVNPLHPVKSAEAVQSCMQVKFPGANVATLSQCGMRVYFADRGDTAKENAGYNACAEAARR